MFRSLCFCLLILFLTACNPAGNATNEEGNDSSAISSVSNGNETNEGESAAVSRPSAAPTELPTAAFSDVNRTSNEGGTGSLGTITYNVGDQLFRIVEGGSPENLSQALDALESLPSGGIDGRFNISPDGSWLVLETERFDPECNGWPCLAVLPADLSSAEAVRAAGEIVHNWGGAAIANGGNLIVYANNEGPHEADLYALFRVQGGWNPPVLLTADSPYNYHDVPAIAEDGQRVLFECGNEPYSAAGTAICEALTDGSEFRILLRPEDHPDNTPEVALRHPDYDPAGGIVFESSWNGTESIWRLTSPGDEPQIITLAFNNDNSPCVLPDGDIISLWLDRDGGQGFHELKRMTPDGANYTMLLIDQDVLDVGLGCSA